MLRGLLAAIAASLIWTASAVACTKPYEPMPFTVYLSNGTVLIREGQCVIDPGFWLYQPRPPHHRHGPSFEYE